MGKKDKKLINEIKDKFFEEVDKKTSWGKEELKKKYLEVQSQVLLDELEIK